jgi:biopolymer transport protein ExbD
MKVARHEPRKARIEIVPMIDTVFFLLVFFMMASLSMTVYTGMPVNLPQAATGVQAASESASVTVDRQGRTFLDREAVAVATLGTRVRALVDARPSLTVIVNADGEAAHRYVVDVLDALRGAGVSRIAVAVTPSGVVPASR